MNISRITDHLSQCHDSLLNLNPIAMGFKVTKEDDVLKLLAGFPINTFKKTLLPSIQDQLHRYQAIQADTKVLMESHIRPHRTQLAGKGLRGVKNTIAIASGKGGVGKSTVTVNLAVSLAKAGASVGILDADIYGPSIPLMLGAAQEVQVKNDHYLPVFAHGVKAMSIGYLSNNQEALMWRGPMLAKALIQMLDLTLWDDLDYLFIDLPPGTGDIQLSLVQKIPLTGAVIVTTPQQIATNDAHKAIRMFQHTGIDILGVIENMSLHTCSQCGFQEAIFGTGGAHALCENSGLPLLGQLPLDRQIQNECDAGIPTASHENALADAFLKTALHLAIHLAEKPINYADKFPKITEE